VFYQAEAIFNEVDCFPTNGNADIYIETMAQHCFYYCVRARVLEG
jgi:hypothetical protein